jgi:uroporphyrinogen decarboxylase
VEKDMSYQIGMDAIHLKPGPRLAHTEYCSNDPLIRVVKESSGQDFKDAWELDLLWATDDGPVPWSERGRVTDMGHAEYLEHGSDRREAKPSPFADIAEVLAFDAVEEYGLPDFDGLVNYYQTSWQERQDANPNQVCTGGCYKTIVSGAIDALGWENLLTAAADQDAFERVLDSIFRLSLNRYKAWAKTTAPIFISHDDMVWSEGAFMDPAFYRRVIFPRFAELWRPLKDAGKKVLFCSDGDWTAFLDDIAEAGADGFIFEPMVSLDAVVQRFGKTHFIAASKVDCRTLTFGTKDEIQAEIDATLELAFDCPGYMFAVGNHIPANVPIDNALFYFDYLKRNWERRK